MVRLAAALAVLASLALATPAHATAPLPWQQKALGLAQTVWHPQCGTLALTYGNPATADVVRDDSQGNGQPVADASGWTSLDSCAITLSQTMNWRRLGYPAFCTVVLHEAGHSAGLPDTNGKGIMRWLRVPGRYVNARTGRVRWDDVDARCIRPVDRYVPGTTK